MMTLDEIRTATINPLAAREAYDQASKRLADILDIKKAYEQKAFTLFNGYVTISLGLIGVGVALFTHPELARLALPFWGAGTLYVIGAICFVLALKDRTYGLLASSPDMWLTNGVIDGDDRAVSLMLAYITFYHFERIEKSTSGNDKKAALIRLGIYVGVISPFVLLGLFLFLTYSR
jgi:hypothetical protein